MVFPSSYFFELQLCPIDDEQDSVFRTYNKLF